jgi:hypothetical protein
MGPDTKPSEKIAQQETTLAGKQGQVMDTELARSGEDRERALKLIQPATDFYSGITSGDQSKITAAAAPIFTKIADESSAARERIYSEVPRGAGQDFALAQVEQHKANTAAGAVGNVFQGAFDKLAGIGEGMGQFSLQELGAALRGGEGASQSLFGAGQTRGQVMQAQAAKKQATMGFLGDVVKAGGSMASAGIAK